MIWVYVFGGIAVVGLIVVIGYAIWLAHKASDVFAEVRVLGQRTGKIAELVGQLQVPDPSIEGGIDRDTERGTQPGPEYGPEDGLESGIETGIENRIENGTGPERPADPDKNATSRNGQPGADDVG